MLSYVQARKKTPSICYHYRQFWVSWWLLSLFIGRATHWQNTNAKYYYCSKPAWLLKAQDCKHWQWSSTCHSTKLWFCWLVHFSVYFMFLGEREREEQQEWMEKRKREKERKSNTRLGSSADLDLPLNAPPASSSSWTWDQASPIIHARPLHTHTITNYHRDSKSVQSHDLPMSTPASAEGTGLPQGHPERALKALM